MSTSRTLSGWPYVSLLGRKRRHPKRTLLAAERLEDRQLLAVFPLGTTLAMTEGVASSPLVATFTSDDPSLQSAANYSASIDWGDGTSSSGSITSDGSGGFDVLGTHTYGDEGTSSVNISFTDFVDSSTASVSSSATISDAALTASGTTISTVAGAGFSGVAASFTDANAGATASDFSATILWGDGNTTAGTVQANGSGGFDVLGTHTYPHVGNFALSAQINDVGGSSASAGSTATVTQAATTTSLTAAPDPSVFGEAKTLTATVVAAPPGTGTSTGTVSFFDGASLLGTSTLSGGVATFTTSALGVGVHVLTSVYSGDADFTGSTSPVDTVTVIHANTATSLTAAPDPSVFGQAKTLTATVTAVPPGAGTSTGTVSFFDGATLLGTSALSGGVASFTTTALGVGSHALTSVYTGDAGFNGSTSPVDTVTVTQASTTTSLTATPDPSVFGQSKTLTAIVVAVPPGAGTPTDTVSFFDGATLLGTSALSGGVATFTSSTLGVGSHSLTSVYSGDADFTGSTSPVDTVTVTQASTTTSLTATPDPSVFGQAKTLTATVTAVPPGAGTSTGTVSFFDGATLLGTSALSGGVATFTTTALGVGSHPLTSVYTGDTGFNGSTSPVDTVTVTQASTTTSLTAAPDPSVFGQPKTLTAIVVAAPPGAGTPTDTVSFFDGASLLGTSALIGGVATFTTSTLGVGNHSLTSVYGGDDDFSGSTSPVDTVTVAPAATTTIVSAAPNASVFGQSVTFVADVSSGAGAPTGTVTFDDNGVPLANGTVNLTTVSGHQIATYTTSTLAAGSHTITADYNGAASFAPSSGSLMGNPFIVSAANTTTQVSSTTSPTSTYSTSLLFTALVTANSPGSGVPSGSVQFYDGDPNNSGTLLGTQPLNAIGIATFTTSTLSVSSTPHSIIGVFVPGNGNDNPSDSITAPFVQMVNPAPLTLTVNNATRTYGDPNPTFTYTIVGFVNGENLATSDVTGSPALSTSASPASHVAGSPYTVTAAPGSLASVHYSFSFVNGLLTVTQAPLTITADDATKVYGAALPTLIVSYSGFVNGDDSSSLTTLPTIGTTATAASDVAGSPYPITASGAAAGDYAISYVDGQLTVTPAPLTVTADNQQRFPGQPNPTLTFLVSGFVSGDDPSIVIGSPAISTTAASSSPIGNYPISVAQGTLSASNYSFSNFVNGTFTVTPSTSTLDFDGVGHSELAVFRPSTAQWFALAPSGGHLLGAFGATNGFDIPVPGDYDGVGHTELAVFRLSTSQWFVLGAGGSRLMGTFGAANGFDIPVPGDYDGVGHTELAVFRPSTSQWFVLSPGGGRLIGAFGAPNGFDVPVPGDYDGVGHTELAVFRPSTSQWFVLSPGGGGLFGTFGAANGFDVPAGDPIGARSSIGTSAAVRSLSIPAVAAPETVSSVAHSNIQAASLTRASVTKTSVPRMGTMTHKATSRALASWLTALERLDAENQADKWSL
jgi:hypothetical protein